MAPMLKIRSSRSLANEQMPEINAISQIRCDLSFEDLSLGRLIL